MLWFTELTQRERRTMLGCFGGWTLDALDVQIYSFVIPTLLTLWGISKGQGLFARSGCVPCHGPNAEGGIGPNLVDNEWMYRFSPGMDYRTIRNGRRGTPMVSFKDRLTPEQTWKIVEFLLAKGREINNSSGK